MKTLIYKITNKVNGKVYIGQTVRGLNIRKSSHVHRANFGERDHRLYLSMRKHGVDNFKFEPVFYVFEEKDLDEFEQHFIAEYNSHERGYNMTSGGNAISEETKEKLRQIHLGRKITWIDKILESRRRNGIAGVARRKYYQIQTPNGDVVIVHGLAKFARERGLDASNLLKTFSGRDCCKGFIVLARFNDYPEREYAQASGSAEHPVALAG